MSSDFSYDPVTAIEEASATGKTAEVFADIRSTMGIPLVTSIWRGLAGVGSALPDAWSAVKPIFESGGPERALARVLGAVELPDPPKVLPAQLDSVGVPETDLAHVRTIVKAYNRSNGMNLVALAGLTVAPAGGAVAGSWAAGPVWPAFPPLLSRGDIPDGAWSMVRAVNEFGAPGPDAGVATLWRHLARWPGLLALVYSAFAGYQRTGMIDRVNQELVVLAAQEGARLAQLRDTRIELSRAAFDTIYGYVSSPAQVARMVTMGHAVARWLGCAI
jgi:hypothetical protein